MSPAGWRALRPHCARAAPPLPPPTTLNRRPLAALTAALVRLPSCFLPSLPIQVRIVDADNGAETINSDFVTMRNISLSFTVPRWAAL